MNALLQPDGRSTSHFGRVNENVAWKRAERGGGSFDNNACAQSVTEISQAQWPSYFDLGVSGRRTHGSQSAPEFRQRRSLPRFSHGSSVGDELIVSSPFGPSDSARWLGETGEPKTQFDARKKTIHAISSLAGRKYLDRKF